MSIKKKRPTFQFMPERECGYGRAGEDTHAASGFGCSYADDVSRWFCTKADSRIWRNSGTGGQRGMG